MLHTVKVDWSLLPPVMLSSHFGSPPWSLWPTTPVNVAFYSGHRQLIYLKRYIKHFKQPMKNKLLNITVICTNYPSHRYMVNMGSHYDCPPPWPSTTDPVHHHNSPLPGRPRDKSQYVYIGLIKFRWSESGDLLIHKFLASTMSLRVYRVHSGPIGAGVTWIEFRRDQGWKN